MRKKEYQWQVIRLRAKGEYFGKVCAADEKAALKLFGLTAFEAQQRLLIRRA